MSAAPLTALYLVTEDWYFCSHRLGLARAAREAGFRVVVATRVAQHADLIRGEGFELRPLDLRRGASAIVRDLGTLARLVRLFRRERPALLHNVALKPVLYGSIAARLAPRCAVVNAFAGLGYLFTSADARAGRLRRLLSRVLARAVTLPCGLVVVQNPDDRHELERLGVPGARIRLVRGSGVDLERFAPRPEPAGADGGAVVVTLVSRMLRDKGVAELVEAARLLRPRLPRLRVRLVGAPDPHNPTSIPEPLLSEWHAGGDVEWLGARADVPAVWAESHVAVLPSYREGLPKTLLEAAACGRPLVATDAPGCREIVRPGESGLLVPPRDARSLAEAIATLAGDPALRRRLGAGARRLVEREFSERRVIDDTLRVYRDALAGRWPA